jgi:hypothetical protein
MKARTNFKFEQGIPLIAGDRYWAQDMVRDMQYLRSVLPLDKTEYGGLLYVGAISKGSDEQHINIGACGGVVEITVTVPDDSVDWQAPGITKEDTIKVFVQSEPVTDLEIPLLDGIPGFIYLRFKESNLQSRNRLKRSGSYYYAVKDDYEFTFTPSADAICICRYIQSGELLVARPERTIFGAIEHGLSLKAPLASPELTGTPTAPTAAAATNNTQIATTAFVMAAIAALVNSSPEALDTLNELAAALGNDADFATTITNALALKAPLASPELTGTPTAPTVDGETNDNQIATTAFVQGVVGDGIKSISKGFMSIWLTNLNNRETPRIAAGSQVEIGGTVYTCQADTAISGILYERSFIYASVNDGKINFSYATDSPGMDYVRFGWYYGNKRAVAKLFYNNGYYDGKVILDSYRNADLINTEQTIPTMGGSQVVNVTYSSLNQILSINLSAGAYRYEIRAGSGGRGGSNKHDGTENGELGVMGQEKSGTFMLNSLSEIIYAVGGNGNDAVRGGGDSGDGDTQSGGGGGCSGGSAFIKTSYNLIFCIGGSGGGGSGSDGTSNSGGGGGGGGGGYSTAGKGNTGNSDNGGEGGNGGSYNTGGTGGITHGSGSSGNDGESVNMNNYYNIGIFYQKGGNGGANQGSHGGAGGNGLKENSSGYLRIYRMWWN